MNPLRYGSQMISTYILMILKRYFSTQPNKFCKTIQTPNKNSTMWEIITNKWRLVRATQLSETALYVVLKTYQTQIHLTCQSWQYQNLSDISIAYDKHLNGSQNICSKYLIIEPLNCKEQERDS